MLYGIKDAANLRIDKIETSGTKPVLYADYCNTTDISFTSDSIFASIKGVKTIRWDQNREGVFRTSMEVLNLGMIALLFGTEFKKGATEISKREVLKVTSAQANLKVKPKTGSLVIFKLDSDDKLSHLAEQKVGTPSSKENEYSIANDTELTFSTTTFPNNNEYIVAYYLIDSAVTAESFSVTVDKFPGNYKIWGDTMVRGQDGVDHFTQFCLPNCKPKSEVNLNFNSTDVTVLDIEWDLFPDPADKEMLKFIKDY